MGNRKRNSALAARAPTIWLEMYGTTEEAANRRAAQKPNVTAGLKCAPGMSPNV